MRYPVGALEDVLHTRSELSHGQVAPDTSLAKRLGITRAVVAQARIRGLNAFQADAWAVAAGLHPASVWESWLDDAPEEICQWCGRSEYAPTARTRCSRSTPCRTYDHRRAECWWSRLDRYRKIADFHRINSPLTPHTAETNQLSEVS